MNNPWQFGGFRSPEVIVLDAEGRRTYQPADAAEKVIRWTAEDEANLARRVARMAAQKAAP